MPVFVASPTSVSVSATLVAIASASASPSIEDPNASKTAYISTTITSIIACLLPLVALTYIAVLSWMYRRAGENPKALNKASGKHIQRYAPAAYTLLLCLSFIEIAFASWLLLQWRFHHNYPRIETRTGTSVLLFTACWTTITGGAYTLLFVHPTWSKHAVSSIGAQAIWVFVTWLLWIISSGIVNASVPSLLVKARCGDIIYCKQIQWMFALSVVLSLYLTAALGALAWVIWQSTRDIWQTETRSDEWE
ncbi:hypothetical protein AX17_006612 [Amanita inopinata Kibby_2008]|nr:hypothetical protein AX17_006612 [Amanita inopinata Kibby_2008]